MPFRNDTRPMLRSANTVLFVCTGNYYRSRFAEEFFNHHTHRRGLDFNALSKGLARNIYGLGNVGPVSAHALLALEHHGITPLGKDRPPISVQAADFESHGRIILLSRDEHQPMMQTLFPAYANLEVVEYWEIEDIHLESPTTALVKLERRLTEFLDELTTR